MVGVVRHLGWTHVGAHMPCAECADRSGQPASAPSLMVVGALTQREWYGGGAESGVREPRIADWATLA